jgi:hypothetical protein
MKKLPYTLQEVIVNTRNIITFCHDNGEAHPIFMEGLPLQEEFLRFLETNVSHLEQK